MEGTTETLSTPNDLLPEIKNIVAVPNSKRFFITAKSSDGLDDTFATISTPIGARTGATRITTVSTSTPATLPYEIDTGKDMPSGPATVNHQYRTCRDDEHHCEQADDGYGGTGLGSPLSLLAVTPAPLDTALPEPLTGLITGDSGLPAT